MIRAELWARGSASLGEGPRVVPSARGGRTVRWLDLLGGQVWERTPSGDAAAVAHYPGQTVSAIIPLRSGHTAVALHRTILREERGARVGVLAPELPAGLRFSDGIAGPTGHLWLGTVDADGGSRSGHLLRVGSGGVTPVRSGVGFANGIGFSCDGTRLFHIDSAAGTVTSFPHRDGELGPGTVLFRMPEGTGALDGLAVDEFDRLWIAVFGAGRVLAVATTGPRRGEVVAEIDVPVSRVTSCAFFDDLLIITTARVDASPDELDREPLAGSVFSAAVGCGGAPTYEGELSS
ncbi:SMP-30/gluconolactonase/LRE family protein [Microbacterium sp.]|uniref:SMP-30/gluconolactonase/LRE family protein n=1 Tax=Microbacterium sp. TaxID=51671 RepID=UPI003A8C23BA